MSDMYAHMPDVVSASALAAMAAHLGGRQTEAGGELVRPRSGPGKLELSPRVRHGTFDTVHLDPAEYLWHTHPEACVPSGGSFRCTYPVPSAQDLLTMKRMARDGLRAHVVCSAEGWFVVRADAALRRLADSEVTESYAALYRRRPRGAPGLVADWLGMAHGWGLSVTHVPAGAPRDVPVE